MTISFASAAHPAPGNLISNAVHPDLCTYHSCKNDFHAKPSTKKLRTTLLGLNVARDILDFLIVVLEYILQYNNEKN